MLRLLVAVLCVCALARGDGFVVSTNVTLPGPRYHGLVAAVSADGSTGYSIEVNELTAVRVTAFGLPSLQFQSNFSATYCALKQHCFLFAAATSLSGNALVGASFAQGTTLAVLDIIAGKETVRQNFTGWIDDDGSGFDSAAALDAKHFIVWNGKFFAVVDLNLNLVSNGSWPSPLQHVSQAAVVNSQTMIAYDDYTVALVSVADGSLSANTTSPERVLVSPFVDAAGANVYFLGYDMTSTNFSIYVYNAANIAAEPTEYIGYGLGDAGSILQVTPTTLVCVVGNPVADDTSLLFSFDLASAAFSAAYPIRESYSIYDVIPTGASNQYLAVGSHLAQSWLALMNDT